MTCKQKNKKYWLAPIMAAGCLITLFAAQSFGAEEDLPVAQTNSRIFRNPFVPSLPQKPVAPTVETPVVRKVSQVSIQPPTLRVNGIVWNTDRPQAIINSDVVGIGDIVAEAKIIDITRGGISFEYQGKRFIIDPSKNITEPLEQIN